MQRSTITKKIPAEVFEIERGYLTPVAYEIKNSDDNILLRKIRKDNTVIYDGNRYTVPTGSFGTYEDVQLEVQDDELLIFAGFCDILLGRHKISFEKGKLIQNRDHMRNKDLKVTVMKDALRAKFSNTEAAGMFLDKIYTSKKRYARDQFVLIDKSLSQYSAEAVEAALQYCLNQELYSALDFRDAIVHFSKGAEKPVDAVEFTSVYVAMNTSGIPGVDVAKRDLQEMIKRLKGGNDTWLS